MGLFSANGKNLKASWDYLSFSSFSNLICKEYMLAPHYHKFHFYSGCRFLSWSENTPWVEYICRTSTKCDSFHRVKVDRRQRWEESALNPSTFPREGGPSVVMAILHGPVLLATADWALGQVGAVRAGIFPWSRKRARQPQEGKVRSHDYPHSVSRRRSWSTEGDGVAGM